MDDAWGWGILLAIALALSGAMSGYTPMLLDRSSKLGMWCIISAPLPLVVWDLMWVVMANPPDSWRRILSILIGAIAGAAILFGASEMWHNAQAQPSPTTQGSSTLTNDQSPSGASGNFNFGQQGGNNYQVYVNQNQGKLQFTDDVANQLLSAIPKDKPLTVLAVGSQSDIAVGQQILEFLHSNGYQARMETFGMLIPPPDGPLTWNPKTSVLTVAPSAR